MIQVSISHIDTCFGDCLLPSWIVDMVSKFRFLAYIPESVTDLEIFNAIKEHRVCSYSDDEEQVAVLRSGLGLPPYGSRAGHT